MRIIMTLLLCLALLPLQAATEVLEFDSPEQEHLYKGLTEELRCTVCQNQNIADSHADLAADLRRKTYKLVREGKSEQEILDYMSQRYGNFVLYNPPKTGGSLLLWIGPFVMLLFGIFLVVKVVRRRRTAAADAESDNENLQRARQLLRTEDEDKL